MNLRQSFSLVERYSSPASQFIATMEVFMAHYPLDRCVVALQDDHKVSLETLRAHRLRQGAGSAIMRKLIALADKLQITVWLTATPLNPSISFDALVAFYSRFGFKPAPDSSDVMIRYPNA
jgi:GNAT superfamily N-acetyltransferase